MLLTKNLSVTTGSGADTVTVTLRVSLVRQVHTSSTIAIDTAAGNDTITFSYGTLVSDNTAGGIGVNAGTGKDTITKSSGTNDGTNTAFGNTTFTIDAGDSLAASYDEITGFDLGTGTNHCGYLEPCWYGYNREHCRYRWY